ncbi:MAG: ABC transporter ATP-binding protein [Oscillospiraceae bacterium]|nr:ABC transporter ATP-binding protein [Oscillospiraceae bacterium]MBQ1590273.1 ABC transporter ATP-binding protein [Oscillospiraceae bacterium]MBQ2204118.1 ABC transporter ATP-binding protein [Oscillospiraceae bacterium]MBQ2329031.1 ABC transporter ATP-binding protein [Oscillospiraceae bacterium]
MSTQTKNEPEKKGEAKEKRRLFDATGKRLVREIRPLRGWIALSAFFCLILIGCAVAAPELLGGLVDKLYAWTKDHTPGLARSLLPGLGLLLGIYAVQAGVTYGNSYLLNNVVSRYFCAELRIRLSDKLRRLPVSYVDQTPAGDVIDRMMEDVGNMADSIYGIVEILLTGFLQMFVIALILFLTDWRMAIPVVLLSPLSVWLSAKMATLGEKHWDKHFNLGGELTALAEEAYTNYPATKAFNREAYLQEKYDDLSQRHQRNGIFGNFLSSIVQPVIVFVDALAYIAVALLGGWLIVHRGMPIGTVVTVILFARQLSAPLERIAFGLSYVQHVKSAAKRVFNLLDLPEEEDPAETAQAPTKGRVEFRNVDFSYDPEKPLIRNLSFSVQPGQKVAIVGPTGAGKTTIVNLLMRFYDIQKGQILIDGEDISKLSRADTRRRFGMVLQDTWLFKGTVAENVAYGSPEATREEIERACDLAYCDHFIRRLPQGYDSVISEDSTAVSSGQKQLLTIARALLADRSLLILDEATSNVDTRTELLIQKAMDRLMGGRTCFVIAHRLSTIVDADCILVIRDGQIVEQGTHRELLDQKGFYYELFNSQYKI